MANNYYCLVSGLPEITINDNKLSFSGNDLKTLLKDDLKTTDLELVDTFFCGELNQEIVKFLQKEEYNFSSLKYSEEDIEEFKQETPIDLPKYLIDFFTIVSEKDTLSKVEMEKTICDCFYSEMVNSKNKFCKKWFTLEQNIKNIMTAIVCRTHSLNIENQIIGDNSIAIQLRSNNSRDFGLSSEFPLIEKLLKISEESNLLIREKQLDLLKFEILEDELFFHSFSTESVLGFVIKYLIVERWLKLDPETGKELFEKILGNVQKSFELPEAYKLNY